MPYTDTQPALPFRAGSQTSYRAAMSARPSQVRKMDRLRELYAARGPMSDPLVSALTGWPRSTVCPVRNAIKAELVKDGWGYSQYGRACQMWRLAGRSGNGGR